MPRSPVLISLLRGINLGPHNRVRMEDLKAVYTALGLRDIASYVQSGNLVFRGGPSPPDLLQRRIEEAIEREFSIRTTVVLRTPAELRAVLARNPFDGRGLDPARLLVHFLAREPEPEARRKAIAVPAAPEEFHIDGREIYIYFPNGMARPKLSIPLLEKALATAGTGRNWNTVTRLLEIAARLEPPS